MLKTENANLDIMNKIICLEIIIENTNILNELKNALPSVVYHLQCKHLYQNHLRILEDYTWDDCDNSILS